ncbi:hypothetical protein EDB84DRAFT_1447268 [Lactarius hengduanensis]|nr:hypothetical protein EDB84DRAFT_1447268 [Lactarius hengduanensis]
MPVAGLAVASESSCPVVSVSCCRPCRRGRRLVVLVGVAIIDVVVVVVVFVVDIVLLLSMARRRWRWRLAVVAVGSACSSGLRIGGSVIDTHQRQTPPATYADDNHNDNIASTRRTSYQPLAPSNASPKCNGGGTNLRQERGGAATSRLDDGNGGNKGDNDGSDNGNDSSNDGNDSSNDGNDSGDNGNDNGNDGSHDRVTTAAKAAAATVKTRQTAVVYNDSGER